MYAYGASAARRYGYMYAYKVHAKRWNRKPHVCLLARTVVLQVVIAS